VDQDARPSAPTSASSVELARRAREGDRRALDTLFQRHVPALRRWASGRLPRWARDIVDTDDMIQETLTKTLNNLGTFEARGDGGLLAYMRQALRNRIVDQLRHARRHPPGDAISERQPDRGASPLDETIGREAVDRYERALGRLSQADREAIVARIEMGYGYDEIARALGKPSPDAARMAIGRALVRLAREMGHG
jgi:RNA polymerase sigma-70 factor (ECF subfamily)